MRDDIKMPRRAMVKPWVLIAAYDVNTGSSPEGYVAFRLLHELRMSYRILLITRTNNAASLRSDPLFRAQCASVRIVGFDLPSWARWWKRGARFYQAYAWLWQMCWPFAMRPHTRLVRKLTVIHVLNFHNDSFPSLAWRLGRPTIWGPVNHNEAWPSWRLGTMPATARWRMHARFALRRIQWRCDPFQRLWTRRVHAILAAGPWVDRRLGLPPSTRVVRRSQLGVDPVDFPLCVSSHPKPSAACRLVYAGRLDWIKGVDLALEALALLPVAFSLDVIGDGPAATAVKAYAVALGLSSRVRFAAPLPRSELPARYARADVFLFPSAEVAGLAWVEALTCGLPVVGFAGETELSLMAPELLGVHLAPDRGNRGARVRAYAEAILSAAREDSDRAAIRARTLSHYAWSRLAAILRETYRSAHAGEGAA